MTDAPPGSFAPPPELGPLEALGEGDYCRAYLNPAGEVVLLARTPEASRAVQAAAALLPGLAPRLPLPVPRPRLLGRFGPEGLAAIAYPLVPGEPLEPERYAELPGEGRAAVAGQLGAFIAAVHATPEAEWRAGGVPECAYPFAAMEDGLRDGPPDEEFAADLRLASRWLNAAELADLYAHQAAYLDGPPPGLVLTHNELSPAHLLFDPAAGRLTGIIDFNGLIATDPARDCLYADEAYGRDFTRAVLAAAREPEPEQLLARLDFLHLWHTLVRFNWTATHDLPAAARHWRAVLRKQLEARSGVLA
ncbi:MAG TPA: phosphotransferase [Deinococcales bacterium]|nr:phosphotransferase [Deinococcales bacterium]